MKLRNWVLLAILAGFGACTYEFLSGLHTEVYHGRVVDEQTGLPLADAVVTVIWHRSSYLGLEAGPAEFLNAQEAVTDSNGQFSLRASSGLDWNPFTLRGLVPWIVVYQPGYEPLMQDTRRRQGFETNEEFVRAFKYGVTVKLRKLRKEEITRYVSREVVGSVDAPFERIPNLFRAINRHRLTSGLSPYTVETPQKGNLQ